MFNLEVRPFIKDDFSQLEEWREKFDKGSLELPYGYEERSVETAVAALPGGEIIGSLTGTHGLILDPYIGNPAHPSLNALFALTRTLEYRARRLGCRDSYIAIPNGMEDYRKLVKRFGFQTICENCEILRHPL